MMMKPTRTLWDHRTFVGYLNIVVVEYCKRKHMRQAETRMVYPPSDDGPHAILEVEAEEEAEVSVAL